MSIISSKTEEEYVELMREALGERERFAGFLQGVPYERKGILYSEMFFFWLKAKKINPKRILESGRARGQSTLILSRIFPGAEIISVEFDEDSPDVPIAEERLAECSNVQLLFGDATEVLPNLVQDGDVVLIDGPKGFRGLRLAFRLLGSGKVPLVFVHDTVVNSKDRLFLEKHCPTAIYSDNPKLAAVSHVLDGEGVDIPEPLKFAPGRTHYGYSLACIEGGERFPARRLLLAATLAGFVERMSN